MPPFGVMGHDDQVPVLELGDRPGSAPTRWRPVPRRASAGTRGPCAALTLAYPRPSRNETGMLDRARHTS